VNDTYPEILSRYFSAVERGDLEVLDTCFTDDATLTDDGRTYHGRAEIRAWREAAGPAYEFVVEVLDWEHAGDGTYVVDTNVASPVSGDPTELKFRFTVAGRLISDLQIAP
jgi:ketosteroid isomerase-like protein